MFPIILVFILRERVNRSDNPTSQRNMNSRTVAVVLIMLDFGLRGQLALIRTVLPYSHNVAIGCCI